MRIRLIPSLPGYGVSADGGVFTRWKMGRYPFLTGEWREMTTHVRFGKSRVRIIVGGRKRKLGTVRREFRVERLWAEAGRPARVPAALDHLDIHLVVDDNRVKPGDPRMSYAVELATLLKFFKYDHLPKDLQEVSKPFHALAVGVAIGPKNSETLNAMRKLLESKDAAVRSRLAGDTY